MHFAGWIRFVRENAGQHRTKIRYVFVGALNTLFGLTAFPLLYVVLQPFSLHYLLIMTLGQIICVTMAFFTSKYMVFQTKGNLKSEYLKFIVFHAAYFIVNLIALPSLINILHLTPVWSQTIIALAVIVTGYLWNSRITFFSKKATLP